MCVLWVVDADLHPGNIFVCKQETQASLEVFCAISFAQI